MRPFLKLKSYANNQIEFNSLISIGKMVARDRIELPTRGFLDVK